MAKLYFISIVFLDFLALLQLPGTKSQDIKMLTQEFLEQHSLQDDLKDNPRLLQEFHEAQETLQHLWTENLPELWRINLSQGCVDSIDYAIPSLKHPFTPISSKILPLLDATGKQGAGLLSGNIFLDGAYDECFSYNYTGYCLANQINFNFFGTLYPLIWRYGLCVPKYCTNTDLALLINSTRMFVVSEDTIKCEDSKTPSYSAGAKIMIVVTSLFVAMVVAGTLVDVLLQAFPLFLSKKYSYAADAHSPDHSNGTEKKPLLAQQGDHDNQKNKVRIYEFLTAFSLFKTVPTLLATRQAPGVITSLNGMRVISMFWVILGHANVTLSGLGIIDNPVTIVPILSRFSYQAVSQGSFFAVDTFLFLSGTLVSYLTLRGLKKKNGRFSFLHFYIHRYLRVTPSYAFVLFFSWSLSTYIGYFPSFPQVTSLFSKCTDYWWTNFLYINNLYPWKIADECILWGWYLANDMQFYFISPFILIPLYYSFPMAMVIVASLLLSSFIANATLVGVYDYQANFLAIIAYNFTEDPTEYFDAIYIKPWSRIQPYLVGMVLGYILYKGVRLPFGWRKNVLAYLLLWVVSGLISFAVVYGLYSTWHGHTPGQFENVLYISLSHFVWGVGMALVVFCCHNGYGWFINSFLSMKMWTPLSRMTFNAYLLHPVVVSILYRQFQKTFHYTDITNGFFMIGFVILSYATAGLVCLLVELPLGTVEMLVFKVVGMTGRGSQRKERKVQYIKEHDEVLINNEENTKDEIFTKHKDSTKV